MSRQRMISPNLWSDPGFLEMSLAARHLFIGLFSLADDEDEAVDTQAGTVSSINEAVLKIIGGDREKSKWWFCLPKTCDLRDVF